MANSEPSKYHVSEDGVTRPCTAHIRDCGLKDSPHGEFNSPEEARAWGEKVLEERYAGVLGSVKKSGFTVDEDGHTETGKKVIDATSKPLEAALLSYEGKSRSMFAKKYDTDQMRKAVDQIAMVMKNGSDLLNTSDLRALTRQLSAADSAGLISDSKKDAIVGILKEKGESGRLDLNGDPKSQLLAEARGEKRPGPSETALQKENAAKALRRAQVHFEEEISQYEGTNSSAQTAGNPNHFRQQNAALAEMYSALKNGDNLDSQEVGQLSKYLSATYDKGYGRSPVSSMSAEQWREKLLETMQKRVDEGKLDPYSDPKSSLFAELRKRMS